MSKQIKNITLSAKKRALMKQLLKKQHSQPTAQTAITPRDQSLPTPLSPAQERIWFLDRFEQESGAYNISVSMHLTGALNVEVLGNSINEVISRHEILRTFFPEKDEQPLQNVRPTLRISLPVIDLSQQTTAKAKATLNEIARKEANKGFDLANGPLLRATLLRVSGQENVLLLTMHHIISDAASFAIFFQDLSKIYNAALAGNSPELAPLAFQYGDYAVWENDRLSGSVLEKQLDYWQQQLSGDLTPLQLPLDYPRPAVQTFSGETILLPLPEKLTEKLRKLSQNHASTLFMTLLSAFQVLLYRYTRQTDITIGSPVVNRNHSETQAMIGYFQNTMVFRSQFSPEDRFSDMLGEVKQTVLTAFENADVSFEKLVETLAPSRDLSMNPLFQVAFLYQNELKSSSWREALQLENIAVKPLLTTNDTAKFDLTLAVEAHQNKLTAGIEFNTDLFRKATILRMLSHFQTILEGIVAQPNIIVSEIPLLSAAEKQQMLRDWNNSAMAYPQSKSLHQLFEAQAAATPTAPAVSFIAQFTQQKASDIPHSKFPIPKSEIPYGELNQCANQLAHYLTRQGVTPGTLIGIYMDRSVEMVVGLLGILKAGGAYLPLDPAFPEKRLAFMLRDAKVPVLLTTAALLESLPENQAKTIAIDHDWEAISAESKENIPLVSSGDQLAYMIYTSGSTGNPKGVQIPHRAVVNFLFSMEKEPGFTAEDRLLSVTTLSFDISVLEIFLPLICGGEILLVDRFTAADGAALLKALQTSKATVMQATPSTWRMLLDAGWQDPLPLKALCGGEAMSQSLADALRPQCDSLWNMYGPTETTIWSAVDKISDNVPVRIGPPIANTQFYILDEKMLPLPIGVPGELYIGGDGLALGYFQRPDLTAEKFLPAPSFITQLPDNKSPQRIYKTGDLARYYPDGRIEFLGRLDQQVKIRGFRIELGEIENVLNENPAVTQAAVIVREDIPEDKRLVAYLQLNPGYSPKTRELKKSISEQLPDYMIPSTFMILHQFPLTPNGKLDRKALPAPEKTSRETSFVAPRTPQEQQICAIWESVLGVEKAGIHDNFFDLGGHSLKMTRVVSRIRDAFNAELPLRDFFENPTIEEQATQIGRLLEIKTRQQLPPISPVPGRDTAPMSFAQQRLWFLDQLEPESIAYNVPAAFRLQGTLNPDWLKTSLAALGERHVSLRTVFGMADDQPVQHILSDFLLHFQEITTEATSAAADQKGLPESVQQRLNEACQVQFDLENGPLFQAVLMKINAQDHILLLNMHHIISDGGSLEILFKEIVENYKSLSQSNNISQPEMPIQYTDFAIWQQKQMQEKLLASQLKYWKTQLADLTPLELPTDHPRPAEQSYHGGAASLVISSTLTNALRDMSRQSNSSLFMTMLATFQVLLHRYSGQTDIAVGTPVSGRQHPDLENVVGMFVNTLVLRGKFSELLAFSDFLNEVRSTCLDAFANQDIPFEKLVEELQPDRDMSRNPLFQVMFIMQTDFWQSFDLPDLQVTPASIDPGTARFDLTCSVMENGDELVVSFEYSKDLLEPTTVHRMLRHYENLLTAIAKYSFQQITDLPLLTAEEQQQLTDAWNETTTDYPENACVHQLFEAQVALLPEKIALTCHHQEMSYRELNERANQFAGYLQKCGIGMNQLVGVYLERSADMLVALLGIFKAGGAYVPLDPAYPKPRLEMMLSDAQVSVIVTESSLLEDMPSHTAQLITIDNDWPEIAQEGNENQAFPTSPNQLAYVIFTSGSTGRPKGVQISQRSLVNFLKSMEKEPGMTANDVLLAVTTLSFDISGLELYLPLITGGKLVLADRDSAADGNELSALIENNDISIMQATPATWRLLLDSGWEGQSSLKIFCGGEALPQNLASELLERCASLWNMYGPTETTIWSTLTRITTADDITIGRPIANTQIFIVDAQFNPAPIGVPGELFIGGDGLAEGYLHRPELTADKFIIAPETAPESIAGRRLYKTGDLARYREDGNIEFLGRIDHQVKIRGFRIELGEIETALHQHPAIEQAVVIDWEYDPGDKRLVAYCLNDYENEVRISELRRYLRKNLPEYMIPSRFMFLDEMPLTPNGKIDRGSLPSPEAGYQDTEEAFQAPVSEMEIRLAAIWKDVLKLEKVGTNQNFFDLGGHSLLAVQVIAKMEKETGQRVTPRDILLQNLGQLAAACEQKTSENHPEPTVDAGKTTKKDDKLLKRLKKVFSKS